MPVWAANSTIEVKVGYRVNGQVCYNVLHYAASGGEGGVSIQEYVEAFLSLNGGLGNGTFIGEFQKVLAQNVNLFEVTAQCIFPVRYALRREEVNVDGLVASDCTAQNIQACIDKAGELGNRHNLGSVHIGGLGVDTYVGGLIDAVHLARLETLKEQLLEEVLTDGLTTAEYQPAILNKTKVIVDGKEKFVISGRTIITEWNVREEVRTQRTRTVGRGI